MKDVTIAGLIVGKRHCRILTVGNINSIEPRRREGHEGRIRKK